MASNEKCKNNVSNYWYGNRKQQNKLFVLEGKCQEANNNNPSCTFLEFSNPEADVPTTFNLTCGEKTNENCRNHVFDFRYTYRTAGNREFDEACQHANGNNTSCVSAAKVRIGFDQKGVNYNIFCGKKT